MVKQNFFTYILCVIGLLMIAGLWGCQGPTGPAGQNADLEGFAPGIVCGNCHNQDFNSTNSVLAKQFEYDISDHYTGGDYTRNTTQCAGCHTNEGFLERYNNGFALETFNINTPSGPMVKQNYPASSPPGCFTCHMPHARGNFSVRDSIAVNIYTLLANQTTKVWNSTPESNLCVKCHQPRMTSTFLNATPYSWQPNPSKVNMTDTAKIYTTRWNNHVSGESAQTLLGFGGFEFTGPAAYSNSEHTVYHNGNPVGCEECHMATVNGAIQNGGHTFAVKDTSDYSTSPAYNVNGCNVNGCHTGLTASASDGDWGKRTAIITELNMLGKMMMDTNITKKYSLPQGGKPVPWVTYTVTGIDTAWAMVNASSSKPLVIVPAAKAGALWNLQQIYYDKSHGVHNYRYTKALLDNSLYQLSQ
jgi:hypothetical protein